MRFAVQLGRTIKSHSLRAFGMMALNDDQKLALKIVNWILRDEVRAFTRRDCAIHCNSAGSVKELEGAFDLLQTHGWIRLGKKIQPAGGGRPSEPFDVNPSVAGFDDKTDETDHPEEKSEENPVMSVSSSTSACPTSRPEPEDADEFDFVFESDGELPF